MNSNKVKVPNCSVCGPICKHELEQKSSLLTLKIPDYSEYLKSDLWKSIRRIVMNRDSHRCTCCGGLATVVHHESYEYPVMIGQDLTKLRTLCHLCHSKVMWTSVCDASIRLGDMTQSNLFMQKHQRIEGILREREYSDDAISQMMEKERIDSMFQKICEKQSKLSEAQKKMTAKLNGISKRLGNTIELFQEIKAALQSLSSR